MGLSFIIAGPIYIRLALPLNVLLPRPPYHLATQQWPIGAAFLLNGRAPNVSNDSDQFADRKVRNRPRFSRSSRPLVTGWS